MINTDPALILNRAAPDPLSPAVPITVDTPCPRCGKTPIDTMHWPTWLPSLRSEVLRHCDYMAVEGDDRWINVSACEGGDPMPFLKSRMDAMERASSV